MKLTTRHLVFILLLILAPLFLSILPFFIQSYMSPSDRVFMGLHRWSEDYYGYLQSINQGLMGHIMNVSKLTLEPHQPTFVHSEYVILGFIGRLLGLNSPLVYHLSRLFLGAVFVLVAFYFFYYLFKPYTVRRIPYAILAFFLAFFVGGFPLVSFNSISFFPFLIPHFSPPLVWWTEVDVLTRSTILPHYLMGNILFLLIIILFLKNAINKRLITNNFFLISLFSFLLSFVHPVDFLILLCSLGVFVCLKIILSYCSRLKAENYRFDFSRSLPRAKSKGSKSNIVSSILSTKHHILLLLLVFISGLSPVLYYKYALSLPFWRFILAHGTTTPYNIPLGDLSLALGPVLFLALGGIIAIVGGSQRGAPKLGSPCGKIFGAVGRQDPLLMAEPTLLFSWLFVQFLFFIKFYEVFNFDRLRTMEAPFYLALAFFATYLISRLILSTRYQILLLLLIVLPTLPTTIQGLKNQIFSVSDFKTFSLFSYPTVKQYQAFQFLRQNTPDNSAITASYEAMFLIPTVSGNKIAFAGNFDHDPHFNDNKNKIMQFYQGLLDPQETYNLFHNNHISYVYWGYQEQSLGGDLNIYPFLQKIFSNGEVTIFKVK